MVRAFGIKGAFGINGAKPEVPRLCITGDDGRTDGWMDGGLLLDVP